MSEVRKLRVLSIAHPAVLRDVGRLRYYPLADRADLDVHLLVPKRWYQFGRWSNADLPNDPGINVHVLPIWFPRAPLVSWYLHIYPGLRRLIDAIDPDVIHLWEEPWSLVALQACLMRGRAALVLEVDQNILKRLVFPFEWIRRHVLRRTDYVLPRSHDAEMVVRACGYTGPVSFIEYGVDQTTFHPPMEVGSGRPAYALRLGYVGRIVVEKGLDDALDALALTPSSVTLSIMGEGPHEAHLRQRITELGLGARVSFRGWGSPGDVADFIRKQDAMLLLTRTSNSVREQFGRGIIECQSCGVPLIGSTCGAIPAVTGGGGWIVPESDPVALADCIKSILADPDELRRRADAGRANVKTRYTYDVIAGKLEQSWVAAAALRAPKGILAHAKLDAPARHRDDLGNSII